MTLGQFAWQEGCYLLKGVGRDIIHRQDNEREREREGGREGGGERGRETERMELLHILDWNYTPENWHRP